MTPPTDTIDINTPVPRLSHPRDRFSPGKPVPRIETLDLSWAVLDFGSSTVTEFAADGGHFYSVSGHRYLVTLRASDPTGVQRATLDGTGKFRASSMPDKHGGLHGDDFPVTASIPHQAFVNTSTAPTLIDLIVVMNPDIGAWELSRLWCKFAWDYLDGVYTRFDCYAYSGAMTFSGSAVNARGDLRAASLTTST